MEPMIAVHDLVRTFQSPGGLFKRRGPKKIAVAGINFQVAPGEIFGLLGQNGAGKTTTIKMLTTLLLPTAGSCQVAGLDVATEEKALRHQINFIFGGELGMYRRLSAKDNLRYFGSLYQLSAAVMEPRITELLSLVGLADAENQLVETFSKGMVQRLQIARGLINQPAVLFMDEPTIGLDALGAKKLHEIILQLKEAGVTIVLTTHYLHEAEELCDQIAIMNHGKILAQGTTDALKDEATPLLGVPPRDLEEAYIALVEADEACLK